MATLDENAEREPQVRQQMVMMNKRLEILHGTIEKIELALNSVLRSPPLSTDEKVLESEHLVPLAIELRSSNASIGRADVKLGEIIKRLEL